MKAIRTRYIPPTMTKAARIAAEINDGSRIERIIISVDTDWGRIEEAHRDAARALMKKMNWSGNLEYGVFKGDYYWVFI